MANASVNTVVTQADGSSVNLGNISGATNVAFIRTTGLAFGAPELKKEIRKVFLIMEGLDGLTDFILNIYYRNSIKDPFQLYTKSFSLVDAAEPITVRPPIAKWYEFELIDNDVVVNWKLVRMQIWGTVRGKKQ